MWQQPPEQLESEHLAKSGLNNNRVVLVDIAKQVNQSLLHLELGGFTCIVLGSKALPV
jgi:cell division inhibitor SulA